MPQMRPCYVKGTPTGTLDLRFWKRWAEKASLHPTSLCTSWLCLILFIQRWDWFNFCWQNQIEFILKYFLLILCLNICLTYLILWFYLIHIEFLRLLVLKNYVRSHGIWHNAPWRANFVVSAPERQNVKGQLEALDIETSWRGLSPPGN